MESSSTEESSGGVARLGSRARSSEDVQKGPWEEEEEEERNFEACKCLTEAVPGSRLRTPVAQRVRHRRRYSVPEKRKAAQDSANAIPETLATALLGSVVCEGDAAVDTDPEF